MKKYDLFLIDPPWPKKKGGIRKSRPNQGRNLDYNTMSVSDIFKLIDSLLNECAYDKHCVFMWTIEQFLSECDYEMELRGYKRHCRIVWDKMNGVAPAFTVRYSHEYLIWYYKPNMIKVAKETQGKFMTVFHEKSREHSRKPDFAYNMINALYPFCNKIDVFSREKRDGWDQFGDQINYF